MKRRGKQEPLDGTDPLLVTMKKYGIPLTRRNYLEMNYPEGFPDLNRAGNPGGCLVLVTQR